MNPPTGAPNSSMNSTSRRQKLEPSSCAAQALADSSALAPKNETDVDLSPGRRERPNWGLVRWLPQAVTVSVRHVRLWSQRLSMKWEMTIDVRLRWAVQNIDQGHGASCGKTDWGGWRDSDARFA